MKGDSGAMGNTSEKAAAVEPEAVSVAEAARMLGYKRHMGYKLIHQGRLKPVRPARGGDWRVKVSDIKRLLEEDGAKNGAKTRRR